MTAVTTSISVKGQAKPGSIEQTIYEFVKATNARDVHGMHYLLHESFQSVEKEAILSKTIYMKMLGDKKLGGTSLHPQIISVDLGEKSASVKLRIAGNSQWAELFIHLRKNDLGHWQILHVLPYISQKG